MAGSASFGGARKLSAAKAHEFSLVDNFKNGYRNREDITNMPAGILVIGSQNVLTNVSERIEVRKGYKMDGPASTIAAPILSSTQFLTRGNGERHLRAGFLTFAGNDGKMQYRYANTAGTVLWVDLLTGLTSTYFNYTTFWDDTEQVRVVLMVNGASSITEWNGAITTIASVTTNTITKQGTTTWAQEGFYTTRDKKIVIRGVTYTYTGGEASTTLTGVTPDPTAQGANTPQAGDVTHQLPVTTLNSAMTSFNSTLANALIATLNNQVFVSALNSPKVYVSKIGNYKDFSFTAGGRLPAEGALLTLDDNIVGFIQQEEDMYVSAGKDLWFKTTFTKSADLTKETLDIKRLKTNPRQGAQSQALIAKMKNDVMILTNEPTFDTLGRIANILGTPQTSNISDSIKLDFDAYDFTDGSCYYNKYYLYVSVPKSGLFRTYSVATKTWEAPQTMPVSSFYTVNGILYAHSYLTSESYMIYTGYADRAQDNLAETVTMTIASPSVMTAINHGLVSGDAVTFTTTGALPTGITAGTTYYVIDTQITTSTFEVSATLGGSAVNTSGSQSGVHTVSRTPVVGGPIDAKAFFSYQNYGTRHAMKTCNQFYIEGYISANTTLTAKLTNEIDGKATTQTFPIKGDDSQIVALNKSNASFGKSSLGKNPFGGSVDTSLTGLPPKFRTVQTFTRTNFYEVQPSFSILGTDQRFELLAFGLSTSISTDKNNAISQ